MKIKALIKKLSKLNPELNVVMSKDAEGNSFSPIADLELCHYEPDSTWSGEIHDCGKGKETAVVFWPTN